MACIHSKSIDIMTDQSLGGLYPRGKYFITPRSGNSNHRDIAAVCTAAHNKSMRIKKSCSRETAYAITRHSWSPVMSLNVHEGVVGGACKKVPSINTLIPPASTIYSSAGSADAIVDVTGYVG